MIRVLTPKEVANLIGVSPALVVKMAARDMLPAMRIGRYWRFREEEIEEWIQKKGRDASYVHRRRKPNA